MTVDTLSDVLHRVRLTGAVFFDMDVYAPWVVEAPPSHVIADRVLPGAEHVIEYHAVIEGACWAGLVDEMPVHLAAGDIVMFVQGDAHVISSAPGMRAPPDISSYRRFERDQLPLPVRSARTDLARTRLLYGFLGCDARPFNPLLATLPRVLTAHGDVNPHSAMLAHLLRFAVMEAETKRVGGEAVLALLSELMFVEAVRQHMAALPPDAIGWLAGLRDDCCGRALSLLHANPADTWTVDLLAREVNLSRAAFAERFMRFVGMPPMQYLSEWRMQVAAGMLADGVKAVSEVGAEVGYASEASFSRAFKKMVGEAPARWRRRGPKADDHI